MPLVDCLDGVLRSCRTGGLWLACALTALASSGRAQDAVSEPRFSPAHGFHDAPLKVEVRTPTPGATIYYTLDGRMPTKARGTRYVRPIDVAGTDARAVVTIRAAAFREGFDASPVATATYIFLDHVPNQPENPAGFPDDWGFEDIADYGMDPEITKSNSYRGLLRESLTSIASLSLVSSPDDLFGPDGIYVNSLEHGEEWERPASAELIIPGGAEGFQVNCGLRIHGGGSRQPEKSPKHSFRLLFKGEYGPTKLEYPLFPDSAVRSFDTVIIRADTNNSWLHPRPEQRLSAQYCRDQWARESHLAMGQTAAHGAFVHLYVNGLYWGLYNLVERPSAPFLAAYFGGHKDDYDALSSGEVVDGDRNAWNDAIGLANKGLGSDSRYRELQETVSVENLIDYMILNIYDGMRDWPDHNWYVGRRKESGAQFQFFAWDSESILDRLDEDVTGVDDDDTPARLYARLRDNAEFRLLFADHAQKHLFDGGALTPAAAAARFRAISSRVETGVISESARWGDYRRDVHRWREAPYELYTQKEHWFAERDRLLEDYFPARTAAVVRQLQEADLYPRLGAPVFSQHGGAIAAGFRLRLSVPQGTSGTVYYTLNGPDPRVYRSGEVSQGAVAYTSSIVLNGHTVVKARTRSGSGWSALTEATFTIPAPPRGLRITEVMYHPLDGKPYEFVEIKNTSSGSIDLSGMSFNDGIYSLFPPATLLPPGAFLLIVSDPIGFADRYPDAVLGGVFDGSLENAGEKLALVDANGEVLLAFKYEDQDSWPVAPDGFGFSLVLAREDADPSLPESWRASARVHGSPGEDDPEPPPGGVIINEILTSADLPLEDAIELYNPTSNAVSLGGWYLSNRREDEAALKKYKIPSGTTLAPGAYLVIYENQLNPKPGIFPSFELDSEGGAVYLTAVEDGDLTGYMDSREFHAAGRGVSLGRHQTTAGPDFTTLERRTFGRDEPASVGDFRLGKGGANAEAKIGPVVINEVSYHPGDGEDTFVELFNTTGSATTLHDTKSGRGWRFHGLQNASETDDFEFGPGAEVPAGGYLLIVGVDPASFRERHGIPAAVPIVGPYGGGLDNDGETLRLFQPAPGAEDRALVEVDHVRYGDKDPWPILADGEGPSLERLSSAAYGNEPTAWEASLELGGTPGATNSAVSAPVNIAPVASFRPNPKSGPSPVEVVLDASASHDPDGSILRFEWDFGDGSKGSGNPSRHTFTAPGVYSVVLTVMDNRGATTSATGTVKVDGIPGQGPGGGPPGGSGISTAFELLLGLLPPASTPPPAGGKRLVELPGTSWLVEGKPKCKVKGLKNLRRVSRVLVVFGPRFIDDDSGPPQVDLDDGEFLVIDDLDRRVQGTYGTLGKGAFVLQPRVDELRDFLAASIELGVLASVDVTDISLPVLTFTGKVKASKKGDRMKLKWKAKFPFSGLVGGVPKSTNASLSFSGKGGRR